MSDYQFHSFPFYSFLKENKLGSGGMNQRFISTPTLSLVLRTHENGWEPVGTGAHLYRKEMSFSIFLGSHEKETKRFFDFIFCKPTSTYHRFKISKKGSSLKGIK